jgi:hypothetical protein
MYVTISLAATGVSDCDIIHSVLKNIMGYFSSNGFTIVHKLRRRRALYAEIVVWFWFVFC